MPIYNLNGKTYNIPDDVVEKFENANPEATIQYNAKGKKYDIPVSKKDGFLKAFPDAQYRELAASEKQQPAQQPKEYPQPVTHSGEPLTHNGQPYSQEVLAAYNSPDNKGDNYRDLATIADEMGNRQGTQRPAAKQRTIPQQPAKPKVEKPFMSERNPAPFTAEAPSPIAPERYQMPLMFKDKADEIKQMQQAPNLTQGWANKQAEAQRMAVDPKSNPNFGERLQAQQEATEIENARKANRREFDKQNFDKLYDEHVSPIFQAERQAGEQKALQEIGNLPKDNGGGLLSRGIRAVKEDIARERYTDPEKIANSTLKQVQDDDSFGDYILNRMGINGGDDGGDSPQLSEREKEWMKQLFATETGEVAKQIISRIYDTYKKENAPKSVLEYIGGKAFHENMMAQLYDAMVRRVAGSSGMRSQLRAMAYDAYGKDQGWLTRIAGGAAPFAVDMIAGGFALPNAIGQAVVKGGVKLAAKQVVKKMSDRAAARGLEGEALKKAASGGAEVAERYIATQAPILNLAIRAAGSAANFATYDMQSEAIRQMANGKFEPVDLIKQAVHGALLGSAMGAVGGTIGRATRNASTLGKVGAEAAGIGAETGIFALGAGIQKVIDEGVPIENVDWADTTGEALGTVIGMKAVGTVMHPREFLNRYRKSKDYDLQLNKRDIDELKAAGYDFDGIFKGLGKFGETAPMSETVNRTQEGMIGEDGKPVKKEEAWVDADAFKELMTNPEISSSTKRKIAYVATGKILTPEVAFGVDINGKSVTTLNALGNPIETKDFKTEDEAQAYYDEQKQNARAATINGLEHILMSQQMHDALKAAKDKTAEETGADVDNLDQLAELAPKDAENALDTYVRNLQEAYNSRFNERLIESDARKIADENETITQGYPPIREGYSSASGTSGTADGTSPSGDVVNRREAAYNRGASVAEDNSVLPGISYDQKIGKARVMSQFEGADPRVARVANEVMQAVEAGDDAEADRLMQENVASMTPLQAEAIEQYRDAVEAQRGVDDAVAQQTQQFMDSRRQELQQIADAQGMITELQTKTHGYVYYKSGELKNQYGGIYVVTHDGQTIQIPVNDVISQAEAGNVDEVLDGEVNDFAAQLQAQYDGIANGSILTPGQQVEMVMSGQGFTATVAGTDAAGNIILQMEDGSQMAMRPEDAQASIEAANDIRMVQQLKNERDAARLAEQQQRFAQGIAGFSEGQIDLSSPDTDPAVAAEYLMTQFSTASNPENARKQYLTDLQARKDQMKQWQDGAEQDLRRWNLWLQANEDIEDPQNVEKVKRDMATLEQNIALYRQKQQKFGDIRRSLMTPDEVRQMEQQRGREVFKARSGYQPQLPQRNITTNDERITMEDGQPNFGLTPVGNVNNYLLKNFAESNDAEQFINGQRIALRNKQRDEVQPQINSLSGVLNAYTTGHLELTPDEVKQTAQQLADLEAYQDALSKEAVNLRQIADGIPALYERNGRTEELTPAEQRSKALENASSREDKLRTARDIYKDYPEALDIINDQEPRDIEEYISQNLPLGKLNWEGYTDGSGRRHIGVQGAVFGDRNATRGIGKQYSTNAFNQYLAPTGQGMSFDDMVHYLYENGPESGDSKIWDDTQIAETLTDMLREAQRPSDISHRLIDNRIAEAEDMVQRAEEYEREMEEQAKLEEMQQWADAHHLDPEEREAFEEFMKMPPTDIEQEIINQIIAENEEQNRRGQEMDLDNTSGAAGGDGEAGKTEVQGQGAAGAAGGNPQKQRVEGAEADTGVPAVSDSDVPGGTQGAGAVSKGEDLTDIPFADRLKAAKGETNPNPTEAQKKAGNYQMGHIRFGGYRMSIENPKGSTRSGVDKNNRPWSIEMQDTYGYIGKKYGADKDHLDFFINDDADLDSWNGRVFVVDQKDEDGSFDEHKVMYGYRTWADARKAYERNYEKGWWDNHVMQMIGVRKADFDKWLDDSDHKTKPFAEYYRTKMLGDVVKDNVDQLLADVKERDEAARLAEVRSAYDEKKLSKIDNEGLQQLRKKAKKDLSTSKVILGTTNIAKGSEKEKILLNNIAQAEADIRTLDAEIEKRDEIRRKLIDDMEAGGAILAKQEPGEKEPVTDAEIDKALMNEVMKEPASKGVEFITDTDEGQRVLDEANGSGQVKKMGQKTNKKKAKIAEELDGKELSPEQQAVVDVYTGKKNNATISYSRNGKTYRVSIRKGNEKFAGAEHSLYGHYDTTDGVITSEDILRIPEILSIGKKDPVAGYKYPRFDYTVTDDNGKTFTVVTELKDGRENFINFYSDWNIKNKEASTPLASNTPEGAHSFGDSASSGAKVQQNSETAKDSERKFFKTPDGHAYGYTYKGKIYIDPRIATSETPIHEYGHLWAEMKRQTSPEEWNRIKDVLLKDKFVKPFIDKVRRDYPELEGREDDFVEEVLTQFSGKRGAEKLRRTAQEIKEEMGGDATTETIVETAVRKVRSLLNEFWKGICDMMGWLYTSAEDIADAVLRDMLNGVNPREQMKEAANGKLRSQAEIERTLMGVHNLSEDKLRKVLKQGGLANPSLAVVDTKNHMHTDYGDISLIPRSSLIDARTGRNAGTFTADAWTPTYPTVQKRMSSKGEAQYRKDIEKAVGKDASDLGSQLRLRFDSYLEHDGSPESLAFWYLAERGLNPEKVMHESGVPAEDKAAYKELMGSDGSFLNLDADGRRKFLELYARSRGETLDEMLGKMQELKVKNQQRLEEDESPLRKKRISEIIEDIDEYGLPYSHVRDFKYKMDNALRYDGKMDTDATMLKARQQMMDGHSEDFKKWLEEKEAQYGVEEWLWNGTDSQGRNKYLRNTLENASKLMKKEGLNGAVSWSGIGSFIATVAKKEKTLEGIRKNKKNLATTKEEHDAFREKWGEILYGIAEKCFPGDVFYGENRLHEALSTKNPAGHLKKEYDIELSEEDKKNIDTFVREVRENFPTGYFETKFERPVMLDEFEIAVVPENTSPDIVEALKNAGLDVRTYDNTGTEDQRDANRTQATMDAVQGRDDIMFQKVGGDDKTAKVVSMNAQTVKMPEKQIEDMYTEGLKPGDAINMQDRVLNMSPRELIAQYERLNSQMLDENGLDIDQQEDAFRQKWADEHGWPPKEGSGFGKASADHFKSQVERYTYNKMALRWDIKDRIEELGLEAYIDPDLKQLVSLDDLPEKTADFVRMYRRVTPQTEKLNAEFNKQLEDFENLPANHRFEVGYPSAKLMASGFPYLPITIRASLIKGKAGTKWHKYPPTVLKDLVKAIQNPLAVFKYTNDDIRNVIVDLEQEGKHFLVAIELGYEKNGIKANSTINVFPKDNHEWIKWIQDGKHVGLYEKEKILDIIGSLRINPAESTRIGLDLNHVAKIVKDFQNPKLSEENLRNIYANEVYAGDETADMLGGVKVKYEAEAPESGTLGWYDPNDNTIHVVLPEHADANEVKRTVCHEKLGHEGLVALMGDQAQVNDFGEFVFDSASGDVYKRILDKANDIDPTWSDHQRYIKAAQEVFADIAENGPRTEEEFSLWRKVKHYIIRLLKKMNIRIRGLLNDHDLAYYVLKTGEALKRWNQMTPEAQKEAARQATPYDIMRSSRRGKPRKKNNESMAQYLQRLREWEMWKIAEERAAANNDPMPDAEQINDRWHEQYNRDIDEWRRANNIESGASGIGEFPKRENGETPQEYAARVADYETQVDAWRDAPQLFDYLQRANDEYREAYRAWKERYGIREEQNVDLGLYEGDPESMPHIVDPEDLEADTRADADLAEAVGIDMSPEGARSHTKLAVIERRKNLESSNAEDAIWIHNLVKSINDEARRQGVDPKELRENMADIIEGTYFEDVIRDDNGDIVTIEDISDQLPIKMTPGLKAILDDIKQWYDYFFHAIEDAGLRNEAGYIEEGYVNHVWSKEKTNPEIWKKYVENFQRTKSPNMRERIFDTYRAGEAIGLVRKFKDIADILAYYSSSNNQAIANKKFLDDLSFIVVEERNGDGEVVNVSPLLNSNKPNIAVADRYDMYKVPGVGDVWVLKDVQKRFSNVFGTMRTKDIASWLEKTGKAWDTVGSTAKAIELAWSGFHALALWEVDMAQHGPVGGLKDLFKYIVIDSIKNGTVPAYAHPDDFRFAASHLVQLGATQDYSSADVKNVTGKLRDIVMDWYHNDNAFRKAAGAVGSVPAIMLDAINKGFDKVLWNYLHDGLKIASMMRFKAQIDKRADRKGLTQEERNRLYDEAGQYVNDMFGGQYFELMNVSPATVKWMRRLLLSPDWLISTNRHFFANFGFGSLYSESGFMNYLRYNADNIKRAFGADIPRDENRRFRSKNAKACYLIGVLVMWNLIYNALNMLSRRADEEKEKEKADEIRKTNPGYKSPYELKYPDGMKWYDYTMYGNALGQQTHLFTGRYEDGSETYARWGKQFREFPELFIGRHGLEFPAPLIERMIAKENPNIGTVSEVFGAAGVRGFEESYDSRDIRDKYGRAVSVLAATARRFIPFSVPTQPEKEFKALDFFMPSSKGFSRWKAVDYFKTFIQAGDMDGIKETYNAAVMNGVDAKAALDAALANVEATQRKEMADGIVDLQSAMERFDAAKDAKERKTIKRKMIKYLADQNYKAFTRDEAVEQVEAFMNGTPETDNEVNKYVELQTSSDVRDDYRLSMVRKQAKQYVNEVKTAEGDRQRKLRDSYDAWFRIDGIIRNANTQINRLKKQLGKEGMDDRATMEQIRTIRSNAQQEVDKIQAP